MATKGVVALLSLIAVVMTAYLVWGDQYNEKIETIPFGREAVLIGLALVVVIMLIVTLN